MKQCAVNESAASQCLRIVVADDEPEMRQYLEDTLTVMGHEVAGVAKTGRELIELCRKRKPSLVISDVKMPEVDGIEAIGQLDQQQTPIPVILVSAHHQREVLDRALNTPVLAYLVKPIKQADLEAAIAVAMRRFREFQALSRETDSLRKALEDRKLIERAKGVLMRHAAFDEPEAFARLQRLASDNNWKLAEAARNLLATSEVLSPRKQGESPCRE